ncbi:MAG: hypothetical protein WC867_01640 [Candidatus Pacearchaeota archaeon]
MKLNIISLSLFAVILMMGLVIAQQGNSPSVTTAGEPSSNSPEVTGANANSNGSGNSQGVGEQVRTMAQDPNRTGGIGEQVRSMVRERVKTETYQSAEGKQISVNAENQDRIKIKSGNSEVETELDVEADPEGDKTRLKVKLSNGKDSEIKVMPDSASEKALERLRLKVCSSENNCTIQLKEVGSDKDKTVAYELKTQRQSKIFGLFKKTMNVEAQVNAETGEVIKTKKPWWAFIASEPKE